MNLGLMAGFCRARSSPYCSKGMTRPALGSGIIVTGLTDALAFSRFSAGDDLSQLFDLNLSSRQSRLPL